ncbi:MAG TPA: hypothetical protein VN457_02150 [Chlamydiales bacterium]|nr:hypothetical protein [Chlamydiales bacterium]
MTAQNKLEQNAFTEKTQMELFSEYHQALSGFAKSLFSIEPLSSALQMVQMQNEAMIDAYKKNEPRLPELNAIKPLHVSMLLHAFHDGKQADLKAATENLSELFRTVYGSKSIKNGKTALQLLQEMPLNVKKSK